MNVSVLGSGFIVSVFLETIGVFKDFHLRGIWGRHKEKIDSFQGFDYYTTDLDEILNDDETDIIYVALPNGLHYEYGMKALKAHKHVMMEKPFCVHYEDAKRMFNYADKHDLILYEMIMIRYNPIYLKMKDYINKLGEIKLVSGNFSQYSRRYDRFKQGIILPVFDKKMAGGALLDLNIYNIHFMTGIFGMAKDVIYYPNIEKGVDTSGVLILDYGKFKATMLAGKDCKAPNYLLIEGDKGYLRCDTGASQCANFEVVLNDGTRQYFGGEGSEFMAWKYEVDEFIRIYKERDFDRLKEYEKESLIAMKIADKAVQSGGMKY